MFGINKNKILHTYLIVKVRKYKEQQPYFSLYTTPAIADETRARETVEKLNSLAKSTAIAVPSDSPYKIISLSFILFKLSQYFTALASLYNPFSLGFPSFPLYPL